MTDFKPTDEQVAILDAFSTGQNLVIEAAAGSGKTSSLKLLAQDVPRRRGLYLAYNRAIKEDAARSFPGSVDCKTAHGLAYGPVATKYRHRLNGPRVPAMRAAIILGINDPIRLDKDKAPLAPQQLARMTMATVARFCHSADPEVAAKHVPTFTGLEDRAMRAELAKAIVPFAQRAWRDLTDPAGQLRFEHDTYLKLYQLSRPRLSFDYLLVDEGQDLNPVVKALVEDQDHAQVCLVGDRHQQLYAWRGAVDAMSGFTGQRLYLTQSFRFGPAIAAEANKWLDILDAPIRVRGYEPVHSTVADCLAPDAILTRSNAAALRAVMDETGAGRRTALVGDGKDLKSLARAAEDLQTRGYTEHPELLAFSSWGEVQEYVSRDETGSDLRVLVDLIDRHGAEVIKSTVDRLVAENRAEVTISTAHKAKGREWDRVRIATDFREPKDDPDTGKPGDVPREEAMLAYVAITRAKYVLDREGLAWVDRWVSGSPRAVRSTVTAASEPVTARAPADVQPVDPQAAAICWRCGTAACRCDPAEAAAYSARLLVPAGNEEARATFLASHDHLGAGQWRKRSLVGAAA